MTIPHSSTEREAAEGRRTHQLSGAFTLEYLLAHPGAPEVTCWEIPEAPSTVRGQLALPDWSSAAAVKAVRAVYRSRGGTVRLRNRTDGGRELAARFPFKHWTVELWQFIREPDAITLGRDNRQLRTELERFARYVDPLGWIREDAITLRRHTASGWWELSTGHSARGEWLLFGPDGSPSGELMSTRTALARDMADRYIAEHEHP